MQPAVQIMDMFSCFGINQRSAFRLGSSLNTERCARVMMFFCERDSCICRESGMREAPPGLRKKQHYASLIKLNSPLPNTVAGLQGCIKPPRARSQADVDFLQQLLCWRHCRLQQSIKGHFMNTEY